MSSATEELLKVIGTALGELYLGGDSSVGWTRALEGLSPGDAARRPPHLPHSVAQIVAHVQFWQIKVLGAVQGEAQQGVEQASAGWPLPDDWERLKAEFLETSAQLRRHCQNAELLGQSDFRGKPQVVGLMHFAAHSVHHLGQVITVRQALDLWPPPGGGDTW